MLFKKFLYKLYLVALSIPLVVALLIIRWKKKTLETNAQICRIPDSFRFRFRLRFYSAVVRDLLEFIHGRYSGTLRPRHRDAARFEKLKAGPSLYLTAHFHDWELMGAWMTRQGIPLLSGARSMANPRSQSLLVWFRRRLGMLIVFEDIPRRALRHLKEGKCFAFLWDQRVAQSDIMATLFGHSVAMDPLPHFLIRHVPVPVHFGIVLPGGELRLIQLASGSTPGLGGGMSAGGPYPISPSRLARRYHRVLECLTRAHPVHWYGLAHRRFQGSSPTL